jgi:hypothetical protein
MRSYMGELIQADVANEKLKEELKRAKQDALDDLNRQREDTDYFEERSRGYYRWFTEAEAKLEASKKTERKQQLLIERQAKELEEERKKAQALAAANSSHSRHYNSLEQSTAMDLDIASQAIAQLTAERDEALMYKKALEAKVARLEKSKNKAKGKLQRIKDDIGAHLTFAKDATNVYTPGMFVHVIGTDNEGKRHLWWGQIGKVHPGKRISLERYWEPTRFVRPAGIPAQFAWKPCSEAQGVPAKDEILEFGAFKVHSRLPISRKALNETTKHICNEQGPLVECTGHTQAEHDAMEARAKAEEAQDA